MAAFAMPTSYVTYSKRWFVHAWMRVWSREKALRWTPVSWRPVPAAIAARLLMRSTGRCRSGRRAPWPSSAVHPRTKTLRRTASGQRSWRHQIHAQLGPAKPTSGSSSATGSTIDTENAIIVDVEATPARTYDEVAATKTMIMRTTERLGLKPARLAADTAYGTGKLLGWLVEAGITPHI